MDHEPDAAGSLKSDGSNYLLWSYMMRNFKIEGELWDWVIESVCLADPKDEDYFNSRKELESMNAEALSIINSYVDRSLKERLAQINNAKDAWDYLAGLYAHDDELEFAKKYRLEKEIEGVKQSGFPITVLYCYLQCYWQQLAEMEPMELSDLKSYKRYREESRLVQLLMALPDKFEPIRKSMLQRDKDNSKTGSDECLYCHQTGHLKADCPAKKKNNDQPFITDSIQQSEEDYEPSSSSSRLASSLTPDNNQPALSTDLSGLSSPASGKYQPPFRRDLEMEKRTEALGELIQLHSPDVICFQLSKLPVKSFSCKPFANSKMGRELCMAEIEVERGKLLIVATSHLESPGRHGGPLKNKWEMSSEPRVAQAKEALNHLKKFPNVVFCGDLNWIEDSDGQFPLPSGWIDAWTKLRPRENGWTYDTATNLMLCASKPAQSRLDRFVCNLRDFNLGAIDMIGTEAIPGMSFLKKRWAGNRHHKLVLPVWPSDHYGLVLKVNSLS
uniref:CCHC-type domain-containing protein n=1 Tax=Fagus sylvatica TaxID=28930 RepID=A0A2N9I5S2_FAGSY